MPKVIFWNIARSQGQQGTLSWDSLTANLLGLAAGLKPDLIVLCEANKGLRAQLRAWGLPNYEVVGRTIPSGNKPPDAVGIGKTHGHYAKPGSFPNPTQLPPVISPTMLRYVLLREQSVNLQAEYIYSYDLANPPNKVKANKAFAWRPALWVKLTATNDVLVAIHARSGAASNTQIHQNMEQLEYVYDYCVGVGLDPPQVFLGDLNVDVSRPIRLAAAQGYFAGRQDPTLRTYVVKRTGKMTHSDTSELDWVVADPSLVMAVDLAEDVMPTDQSDDDEYLPDVNESEKSDHKAIVIEW
jgi:hypothetical protein